MDAFWFRAEISPSRICNFQIREATMVSGFGLLALGDEWSFRALVEGEEFDRLLPRAESTLQILIGAFAVVSGTGLSGRIAAWIEQKGATPTSSVVGRSVEHEIIESEEQNEQLRAAVQLVDWVEHIGDANYRFALHDTASAARDGGDDALLFAHRAVADCVRALSPDGDDRDWPLLHSHLGQTAALFRETFDPLQAARDSVAHGDRDAAASVAARDPAARDVLLRLSRQIVHRSITQSFLKLFTPLAED